MDFQVRWVETKVVVSAIPLVSEKISAVADPFLDDNTGTTIYGKSN